MDRIITVHARLQSCSAHFGRIAHTLVSAPLQLGCECERAAAGPDRQVHDHVAAIDLELPVEGSIELDLARGIPRRAELYAIARVEAEALAIEIVTIRDGEVRLDSAAIVTDRSGELERIFGVEQVARTYGRRGQTG